MLPCQTIHTFLIHYNLMPESVINKVIRHKSIQNMTWLWKITIIIQIFIHRAFADSQCDYCVKSV